MIEQEESSPTLEKLMDGQNHLLECTRQSCQGKAMDIAEFTQLVDDFNYLLARISKYLKNNQYVYLRAFHSWQDCYNLAAERLNSDKTIRVPFFKLTPIDYSPSGKTVKQECVGKFVKTVSHQVSRLEEKINALKMAAADKLVRKSPLERFFHRGHEGLPIEPLAADKRIFVAIPAGEIALHTFWQGIQPALETQGLSFFLADHPVFDDAGLCEFGQELHSCRLAICNISGQAANVMLALGLAYGAGKPVIIVQQQDEATLGALAGNGYVHYTGTADLKTSLSSVLAHHMRS